MKYSFIIITKNEELNIEACLKSIFEGTPEATTEIILVDSNSRDETISRAEAVLSSSNYQFSIINIVDSTQYSAALGRSLGTKAAQGEYLVFLDGDMTLAANFLSSPYLEENLTRDEIIGIVGIRDDYIYNSQGNLEFIKEDVYKIGKNVENAYHFGGAILLKKEALIIAGGYNEKILASEEPELYIRLKSVYPNAQIIQVPIKMINHHINKIINMNSKEKILQILRINKRSKGLGQTFKECLKSKKSFQTMIQHKPIRDFFVPFVLINMFFLSLIFGINEMYIIPIITILVIILECIKNKTLKKFIYVLFNYFYIVTGLVSKQKLNYRFEKIGEKIE